MDTQLSPPPLISAQHGRVVNPTPTMSFSPNPGRDVKCGAGIQTGERHCGPNHNRDRP